MSEAAAPAAPSQSAPVAQPAPGPAATTPAAVPAPSPVRDAGAADGPDSVQRLAKPIRPIPSLPGVYPDDDPFPPPPSRADSPPAAGAAPPRGPDGRFVASTSSATADAGVHPSQTGDAPPPPQPTKFKIAGEEHASQEAFEQQYRSLKGQYRPLQSLARSLGGVDKIVPQFASAAESARGWKAEADRLSAELSAIRGGQPAKSPAANPNAAPADVPAEGIDWELYAEVKKLATESGEPWKAEKWLIEEVQKAERTRLEKTIDERLAPFTASQEHQAKVAQTENLFGSLAEYTHADGSPAFPELHDEAASYEIGRLWSSLGLPAEAALTPQGAIAAIAIYRMARGSQAKSAPAAPPTAPPAPALPTATDALAAAALGGDGRPLVASAPGNGDAPSAEAARILAGLRSVNQSQRNILGFDA